MTPLAFIDTETTGLDPVIHEVWEVGLVLRSDDHADEEYVWQLPVDLAIADPTSLRMNGFLDRRWPEGAGNAGLVGNPKPGTKRQVIHPSAMPKWCRQFMELTRGFHLVGNVVSFDEKRLEKLLRRHGAMPMWHYHLIDVEPLVCGFLAAEALDFEPGEEKPPFAPPWSSRELSRAMRVDPPEGADAHTALADALWARNMYDKVIPPW